MQAEQVKSEAKSLREKIIDILPAIVLFPLLALWVDGAWWERVLAAAFAGAILQVGFQVAFYFVAAVVGHLKNEPFDEHEIGPTDTAVLAGILLAIAFAAWGEIRIELRTDRIANCVERTLQMREPVTAYNAREVVEYCATNGGYYTSF